MVQQAEHFCNSIGILQQFSTPSKFLGFDRSGSQTPQQQQNQEDYAVLFATLISRCAKDIDTLIESLPSEESSTELQVQSLRRLEAENKEAAEKLEEVILYFHFLVKLLVGLIPVLFHGALISLSIVVGVRIVYILHEGFGSRIAIHLFLLTCFQLYMLNTTIKH